MPGMSEKGSSCPETDKEVDPLNYIYYVNGKDYLADVRKALGK